MLAKQLFNKCSIDSRKILTAYTLFMYEITNKDSTTKSDFMVSYRDTGKNLDIVQTSIFYFLYMGILTDSDIFKKNMVTLNNLDKFFYIKDNTYEKIKTIYENALSYYPDFIEYAYSAQNGYATSILTGYSDFTTRSICYERILVNLAKGRLSNDGNLKLRQAFKIDEVLNEFDELAKTKEKNLIMGDNTRAQDLNESSDGLNLSNVEYGENLTNRVYEYDPLIGRQIELRNLSALLMDEEKSLILHGAPGVGKTTIVKGLAYKIQQGTAPKRLQNKQIVEVSASEMVRGCQYVGMVEERMLQIIESLIKHGNSILFVDEIHTLMGIGAGSKSNNDVSNILKPYLGDGRIKILGATTTEEYQEIKNNGAFNRRFNSIEIPEPNDQEVLKLLNTIILRYKKSKDIGFEYVDEIKKDILNLLFEISNEQYKNSQNKLYNPDLALTLLRNGYNYAMLDGKQGLDADSMIEGVNSTGFINKQGKEYFSDNVLRLVKR